MNEGDDVSMDPNDPKYSDTPNVDKYPLEGRRPGEPAGAAVNAKPMAARYLSPSSPDFGKQDIPLVQPSEPLRGVLRGHAAGTSWHSNDCVYCVLAASLDALADVVEAAEGLVTTINALIPMTRPPLVARKAELLRAALDRLEATR